MIKFQKRIVQYVSLISLGPIGMIIEKHFMFKQKCTVYEYILAIAMCVFTFFLWYLYRKEKRNCKVILKKIINERHIVTISQSKWNDLIVKISLKSSFLDNIIYKTVYNPQLISEKETVRIKWKRKLGLKFLIIDDNIGKEKVKLNADSFSFEFDDKKFDFYYRF